MRILLCETQEPFDDHTTEFLKKLLDNEEEEDIIIDNIDSNTLQSPLISDWVNESPLYDVIIVGIFSYTPLDIYVWYTLLALNGKLLIKYYDHDDISKQVFNLLFTDSTNYFTRIDNPIEDPWSIILRWSCSNTENYSLMQRVLSLAPQSIIEMFSFGAKFITRKRNDRNAEEILKIISSLGIVDPPKIPNALCSKIRGLDWRRNSCYMDTSLHCMLAVPSILSHFILNINLGYQKIPTCGVTPHLDLINRRRLQEELRYIVATIRGNSKPENVTKTADKLRLIFRTCDLGVHQQWWSAATQEAGELITWILSLFPVDFGIAIRKSFATNDLKEDSVDNMTLTSTNLNTRESPVVSIYQHDLGKGLAPISTFLTNIEDSGDLGDSNLLRATIQGKEQVFRRSVRIKELIKAPGAIIFNVHRGIGGERPERLVGGAAERWTKTPIDPDKYIELQYGQLFEFSGVILYTGTHYTCCYKCKDIWYHYDDLSDAGDLSIPIMIGDYETLMNGEYSNSIRTRGTVYFYNQIGGPKGLPVPDEKAPLGNRKSIGFI